MASENRLDSDLDVDLDIELSFDVKIGQTFRSLFELEKYMKDRSAVSGEKWVKGRGNKIIKLKETNGVIKRKDLHFRDTCIYSRLKYQCAHYGDFVSSVETPIRKRT